MLKFIKDLWQERFKFGLGVTGFHFQPGRYSNGELFICVNLLSINSPGTGHWPFNLFELKYKSGAASQLSVDICGFSFGYFYQHCIDENGVLTAPDFKRWYWLFSCINHRGQTLEEVI